jgi:two-component system osmolarity sensor histidine kinase EnvZ
MRSYLNSLEWLRSGLFWRTFFLLAILVMASMMIWFVSFKTLERTPRAQQLTAQITSIVTITRAALTHSAPEKRKELLLDLAHSEGIRIYLRNDADTLDKLEPTVFLTEFSEMMKAQLGKETRFARSVNGNSGFWISLEIEGDHYWLRLDEDRLEPPTTLPVLSWITATLLITLLGAAVISKFINDPLSRLSNAARLLAQGKQAPALPERGEKKFAKPMPALITWLQIWPESMPTAPSFLPGFHMICVHRSHACNSKWKWPIWTNRHDPACNQICRKWMQSSINSLIMRNRSTVFVLIK